MTILEPHLGPPCLLPRLSLFAVREAVALALESAGCAIVTAARPQLSSPTDLDVWFARAHCSDCFALNTKRFSGRFAKAPGTATPARFDANMHQSLQAVGRI